MLWVSMGLGLAACADRRSDDGDDMADMGVDAEPMPPMCEDPLDREGPAPST